MGTGLGLAVVYGVVQQAGGAIEVDSSLGRGTTFRIYLPTIGGLPTDAAEGSVAETALGTERVLLVEDDDAVRRIAARALQTRGYGVVVAGDGIAALELVRDDAPPALLVTDVVMPGLDGVTLAERLRTRFPRLKVLFTSGYIDDTLTRRGLDREHAAFLQKPYSPQTLAQRIREVLDA
ncbi:MAG: response regulator [Deltaproteobacteria bacterium]|nr:response regulator [Deltaproteobacteria bacterium]